MSLIIAFTFGTVIGSFLNVVAFRRINNESFIYGRSKCPRCDKRLAWYDNVPILSFLILKGRCRRCENPIQIFYPIVELTTGILTMTLYKYQPNDPQLLFCLLCIGYLLIIMALIDFFEKNVYTDHLAILLLVTLILMIISKGLTLDVLIGSATFGGFFLLLRLVGSMIYQREAVGLGDVQLGFVIGIALQWQDVVLALYITFISASFVGAYMIYQKKAKDGELPLIPFISAGFMVALTHGPQIRGLLRFLYYG